MPSAETDVAGPVRKGPATRRERHRSFDSWTFSWWRVLSGVWKFLFGNTCRREPFRLFYVRDGNRSCRKSSVENWVNTLDIHLTKKIVRTGNCFKNMHDFISTSTHKLLEGLLIPGIMKKQEYTFHLYEFFNLIHD